MAKIYSFAAYRAKKHRPPGITTMPGFTLHNLLEAWYRFMAIDEQAILRASYDPPIDPYGDRDLEKRREPEDDDPDDFDDTDDDWDDDEEDDTDVDEEDLDDDDLD